MISSPSPCWLRNAGLYAITYFVDCPGSFPVLVYFCLVITNNDVQNDPTALDNFRRLVSSTDITTISLYIQVHGMPLKAVRGRDLFVGHTTNMLECTAVVSKYYRTGHVGNCDYSESKIPEFVILKFEAVSIQQKHHRTTKWVGTYSSSPVMVPHPHPLS